MSNTPPDDPYPPVRVEFHEATLEQVARALCAAAKPPDPSKAAPTAPLGAFASFPDKSL